MVHKIRFEEGSLSVGKLLEVFKSIGILGNNNSTSTELVICKNVDLPDDCTDLFNDLHIRKIEFEKGIDTSNVNCMEYMFSCIGLEEIKGLEYLDTSNVTNMSGLFSNLNSDVIDVSNLDTSNVKDMSNMFSNINVEKIIGLEKLDTKNAIYMDGMFSKCKNLKDVDISHFNTGKVVDMNNMFRECTGLKKLDLSNLDLSNVKNIDSMFYRCNDIQIDGIDKLVDVYEKNYFSDITLNHVLGSESVVSYENSYIDEINNEFIKSLESNAKQGKVIENLLDDPFEIAVDIYQTSRNDKQSDYNKCKEFVEKYKSELSNIWWKVIEHYDTSALNPFSDFEQVKDVVLSVEYEYIIKDIAEKFISSNSKLKLDSVKIPINDNFIEYCKSELGMKYDYNKRNDFLDNITEKININVESSDFDL